MKLHIFYYINPEEEDEEMDKDKKIVLETMNRPQEYISREEFNKLYLKTKAKLKYKEIKEDLKNKRKGNMIYCEVCQKEIQKNTYDKTHLSSQAHIKAQKELENKNKVLTE
jgi:hypothetical protein